jgi:hypothetical protein
MLKKVWLLLIAVSTPLLSSGDPVPAWIPAKFAQQTANLSTEKSEDPVAILYLCTPFCETVGEFLNRTNFKIIAKDLIPEVEKPGNLPRLRLLLNPMAIIAADPADNHEAEKMAGQQKLDRHGNPEDMPKEDDEGNGDQQFEFELGLGLG